jgi:hypothetical protein
MNGAIMATETVRSLPIGTIESPGAPATWSSINIHISVD